MSTENGNRAAPEMLSLAKLIEETQTEILISEALAARLGRASILCKAIDGSRFRALFPLMPAGIVEGEFRELGQRERAWLEAAEPNVRIAYQLEVEAVKYRAIALSALAPRLNYEQAERLGDEALAIYQQLLEFSGLLAPAAPQPAANDPALPEASAEPATPSVRD